MPALLLRRDDGDTSQPGSIVGIWPAIIAIVALFMLGGMLFKWVLVRRARQNFRPLDDQLGPPSTPLHPPPLYPPAYAPVFAATPADSPFLAPAPPSPALPPEPASPSYTRFLPDGHLTQKSEGTGAEPAGERARRAPAGLTLEQGSLFAGGALPGAGAGLAPPPYSPSVRGIGSDIRGT